MLRSQSKRRLFYECLEHRHLLAGDVMAAAIGGSLIIKGDDLDNIIRVDQSGLAADQFRVGPDPTTTINGQSDALVFSGITKDVRIRLAGGNDRVDPAEASFPRHLNIDGGSGDNIVNANHLSVVGKLSVRNDDGFDRFGLLFADIGGSVTVDNGDGDSETIIDPANIGGNLVIRNGNGFDLEPLRNGSNIAGKVFIQNGDGGSQIEIGPAVVISNDLTVSNGEGNDSIGWFDSTFHDDVNIRHGKGGSSTGSFTSFIGGNLSVQARDGVSGLFVTETEVQGSLKFHGGNSDDFVRLQLVTTITGDLVIKTADGNDAVEILQGVTVLGNTTIDTGPSDDFFQLLATTFASNFTLDGGLGTDTFEDLGGNIFGGLVTVTEFEIVF